MNHRLLYRRTLLPLALVASVSGYGRAQDRSDGPVMPSPLIVPSETDSSPKALFLRKCGACHASGGTGAMQLARRLGPDQVLLSERRDLMADYIRLVVRQGLGGMPVISRGDLSDRQLDMIAEYLTRNNGAVK